MSRTKTESCKTNICTFRIQKDDKQNLYYDDILLFLNREVCTLPDVEPVNIKVFLIKIILTLNNLFFDSMSSVASKTYSINHPLLSTGVLLTNSWTWRIVSNETDFKIKVDARKTNYFI